jgi:hypothetical protein
MKTHRPTFSVLYLVAVLLAALAPVSRAAIYQWSAVNGEPNRRIYLWIPEDCKRVRGLVLVMKNMIETGISDDPVFRDACRRQRVGILWVSEDRTATGFQRSAFNSDWGWPSGLSVEDEREYYRLLEITKKRTGVSPEEKLAAQAKVDAWNKQLAAAAGPVLDGILKRMADESGYAEIKRAPLFFLSHSMGGLLCWHAPYRIPDRCWGSIPLKTGVRGAPKDIPTANMHGVPILYINQIDPEGPDGQSNPGNSCIGNRRDTENLVCQLFDWASHHLETTPELATVAAMFLEKAGKYRLCDEIPPTGYPKLKELKASDGWLATSILEPRQYPMAPEPQYTGPREKAFWFFDEEMAKVVTNFRIADRKKKPQYVTATSDGKPLEPLSGPFESIQVPIDTAVDDGWTFKLRASLLDTVVSADPAKRVATGHASRGKAVVHMTGGHNWAKLDDETFRWRQYNRGPHGHGWVVASHPGDADYARACNPLFMWMPSEGRQGTPQTITFPEIQDVPAGTKKITLRATSNVPGQVVEYYVVSGPAEITGADPTYTGSTLRLTPIPPNAKFPVKVIVVAYQKGRLKEPLVQTAPEVVREFFITKTRQ